MKQTFLLLCLIATLIGCERIETPEGTIPAEYMEIASRYEGSYVGEFAGLKGKLSVAIIDAKPVLSFEGTDGSTDILKNCNSKIGRIKVIYPQKQDETVRLDVVEFEFSPGTCRKIIGKKIALDFKHSGLAPVSLKASILDHETITYRCRGRAEDRECNEYRSAFYKNGTFNRE